MTVILVICMKILDPVKMITSGRWLYVIEMKIFDEVRMATSEPTGAIEHSG